MDDRDTQWEDQWEDYARSLGCEERPSIISDYIARVVASRSEPIPVTGKASSKSRMIVPTGTLRGSRQTLVTAEEAAELQAWVYPDE